MLNEIELKANYKRQYEIRMERDRKKGRARDRMVNTVRTDKLEGRIAHLMALCDYEGADAIRELASDIGAPINDELIELDIEARKHLYFK